LVFGLRIVRAAFRPEMKNAASFGGARQGNPLPDRPCFIYTSLSVMIGFGHEKTEGYCRSAH
jgi:hypothetical protein